MKTQKDGEMRKVNNLKENSRNREVLPFYAHSSRKIPLPLNNQDFWEQELAYWQTDDKEKYISKILVISAIERCKAQHEKELNAFRELWKINLNALTDDCKIKMLELTEEHNKQYLRGLEIVKQKYEEKMQELKELRLEYIQNLKKETARQIFSDLNNTIKNKQQSIVKCIHNIPFQNCVYCKTLPEYSKMCKCGFTHGRGGFGEGFHTTLDFFQDEFEKLKKKYLGDGK